jgi:hypothetical protein
METEERDCLISFKLQYPGSSSDELGRQKKTQIPVARKSKRRGRTRGKANEKGKIEVQSTLLPSSCFQVNFSSFAR